MPHVFIVAINAYQWETDEEYREKICIDITRQRLERPSVQIMLYVAMPKLLDLIERMAPAITSVGFIDSIEQLRDYVDEQQ